MQKCELLIKWSADAWLLHKLVESFWYDIDGAVDTVTVHIMTLPITTLLRIKILIILKTEDITFN